MRFTLLNRCEFTESYSQLGTHLPDISAEPSPPGYVVSRCGHVDPAM